jgi:ornithine decarboxylase
MNKGFTEKQLVFNQQLIEFIDEGTTPLDYVKRVISDYNLSDKDDPFYVMDVGEVLRKHAEWCRELPRVRPYYAVKCNNNPILLAILAHVGCSFDCASIREIESVMAIGVGPNRIIYANPCKTPSFIRQAAVRGVKMMTFDHELELTKVHKLYPNAELVLRIAVSDPTAVCQLNLKFGCDPVTVAPKLLKKAADMGVKVVGISFHVGSGCRNPAAYEEAIAHCRNLFDLGDSYGHNMYLLDIGGGFPGHNEDELTFPMVASVINNAIAIHFPPECGVDIIGEPGRFYATSAYTLCVNIIARNDVQASKITKDEADCNDPGFMYYVNDGVYGSFNNIMFDHAVPKPTTFKKPTEAQYWSAVWGPTCDSMDCVLPKERLPQLEEGEWIVFENMGAYTMAASSEFNGFQRPNIYYIITEKDAALLTNTVRRSLSCDEPLANVPLPYVPAWPMDEESDPSSGYLTDVDPTLVNAYSEFAGHRDENELDY